MSRALYSCLPHSLPPNNPFNCIFRYFFSPFALLTPPDTPFGECSYCVPCRRCLESLEVDKGEAKALREQLNVSESARKALYDEKCELEEAENDARLMVQR